jgi:hypothetical protein
MPRSIPLASLLAAPAHRLLEWPTSSQRAARRNAMFATTALMHRKIERDAVNEYLAEAYGGPESVSVAAARFAPQEPRDAHG